MTRMEYDGLNRVTKVVSPNGSGYGYNGVTFTVPASVNGGDYPIAYKATAGGASVNSRTRDYTLKVASFSLAVTTDPQTLAPGATGKSHTGALTMINGYATSVAFSVTGMPSGMTVSAFSQPSRTSSGNTTFTVTAGAATAPGTYTLNFVGTSGAIVKSVPFTVVVAPDFTISATPSSRTITAAGTNVTYTTTLTYFGLTGTTTFSVTGLPAGVTGTFAPTSLSASGTSTLTIAASGTAPGGTYTVTITGTNGSLVKSTTVTLLVRTFALSASPTTRTIVKGQSTTYTITLTYVNGFTGTVTFGTNGTLPTGVTVSYSPASLTSAGTTTMTVQTTASTPVGTHTITAKGTSGSGSSTKTQTVPVTLIVQ